MMNVKMLREPVEVPNTRDVDACLIGILLMRFDLADKNRVTNFFTYVLSDIFKIDDAEGVLAFQSLVIGDF